MRPYPLIALVALLAASPAVACTGQSVHLSGDFQTGDAGWGPQDAQFQPKGAEAVFTPQVGTQTARWNAGTTLTDLDACVTVALPETTADATRSYAGLLFWVTDKDNFYEAVVSPNGMFTVARKMRGRIAPTAPVMWTQTAALKLGPNTKNTLRVTIEGQTVAVRINDTEVARFRGQSPDAASRIGLVASSAPGATDTWRMTDFKVTNVAPPATAANEPAPPATAANVPAPAATAANAPAPAAAADMATGAVTPAPGCAAGNVLFEDNFKDHDPNWGAKDGQLAISGGEAVFSPEPGKPTLRWNRVFAFDDVDACVSVRLAKETSDPTASYAGLIFWVQDSRNYYEAVIAPNGFFTVARIVEGKPEAKRPVEWKKYDAVNMGAKAKNTLRVTAKGADVQIAINGKPAASFKGEPPRGPSYIGMLAASAASKKGDTWSISDFKVTAPQ